MLRLTPIATASLLALAAMLDLPGDAQAGPCVPGTGSTDTNTCIGAGALDSNNTGISNTASGYAALTANTNGFSNTANGYAALYSNTTGNYNTASGVSALYANTEGFNNTASGISALGFNISGANNTASGYAASAFNKTGSNNTGIGSFAGARQTGSNNTSIGAEAGWRGSETDLTTQLTGSNNIAVGYQAGSQWTTGSNNIAIGNVGGGNDANTIRIGGTQTTVFFSGIYATKVTKTRPVLINANGQLGTSRSSLRYKEDVHSMGDASNALMDLRPVTYRYKQAEADGSKPVQYGLIAEEVDKVMPDLVVYDEQGRPDSVSYEILPSLLLNEYQKQARELEDVKAELAALRLVVSRLAAAPSAVKVAASAP